MIKKLEHEKEVISLDQLPAPIFHLLASPI